MTEQMPLYTARDETAPSILELAWQHKVRVERLRAALKREEEAFQAAIDEARDTGVNEAIVPHGTFRLDVKPGKMIRVIDVEAFRANYPKEFEKAATFSVKITDAERVLGTDRLGELCTMRTSADRVNVVFEPRFDPLAPKEATDA